MINNKNKKIIISIDGYSSSGKSSLSKQLAEHFKYYYINTGDMYRGITLLAIRQKMFNSDLWNVTNFIHYLNNIHFTFKWNKKINEIETFLNNENIKNQIKSRQVTEKVSLLASIPEIREKLNVIQKKLVSIYKNGLLIEGRDIGTTIFPQAKIKIFMKGSTEIRSFRRYKELKKKGEKISYEKVKQNILYRDMLDISRKYSPLQKPIQNCIEIDNTYLSINKQFNIILQFIKNKLYT
ncbi:(d)CMP kinase [Blattabacterium cuenoti]|uniref:(d)CMP kinase n=1 Tax=Blattabacterium cuenoti TaxID=1653831 RepID=UPI00163C4D72|nr:(d)CMP kinase [Blattabacterium cuenoti]